LLIETPGDEIEISYRSLVSEVELFVMFMSGKKGWSEQDDIELDERGTKIAECAGGLLSVIRKHLMSLGDLEL
jgi:hypothetical protein